MNILENKKAKTFARILFPRIVAIMLLIGTGFGQVCNCGTMIVTAAKLDSISRNISYIEEVANNTPSGWSTEKEEDYQKYIDKRNALINSSDHIVAKFAQANHLQRFGQFILPLIAAIMLLYSGITFIPSTIRCAKRIFEE